MYRACFLSIAGVTLVLLSSCQQRPSELERVKARGLIRVAIANAEHCTQGESVPGSLECELPRRFAKTLGVVVKYLPAERLDITLSLLDDDEARFAAGLPVLAALGDRLRFTPAYRNVTWQLVYRQGRKRPKKLADLAAGELVVAAGSVQEMLLKEWRTTHPELSWVSQPDSSAPALLEQVQNKRIGATLADSTTVMLQRRHFPELRVAFELGEPSGIGWAFPHRADDSLYRAALDFLDDIRHDGTLRALTDRYYAHADRLNYVDQRSFQRHLRERLPAFRPIFERTAKAYGLSWRLLAAIGYQESHWNPKAVSPTGVRGLMMLSRVTAKRVGIADRTDPAQSILGAARYLLELKKKIPKRIPEPDHTWLTLAAYNIGFGHLEDARILAQRMGGNPDRWMDVRRALPLLEKAEIAKTLKRGMARGNEAVTYVENIRNYLEMLEFLTRETPTKNDRPVVSALPEAL